jgi:hypothetical protein
VPSSEIQGDDQPGCLPVSSLSARPNVGRYLPKFNSKSLGTPYPILRILARRVCALGKASIGKNKSLLD